MKQLFKTFRTATAALGMVLAMAAGSATAASLDQFTPVIGGATVSGAGAVTLGFTGIGFVGSGVASGGGIAGPVVLPSNSLTLTAAGSTIVGGSFISLAPPFPFLSGSFEDARAESGVLSFLFAINGGSAASIFGSHVIYTLNNPTFTIDTFNLGLIQPPGTVPATPVSFSITQATPIPLPAGLILLLTGLGALGLARRRASV